MNEVEGKSSGFLDFFIQFLLSLLPQHLSSIRSWNRCNRQNFWSKILLEKWRGGGKEKIVLSCDLKATLGGLFCLIFWFLLGGHQGVRATLSHGFWHIWMVFGYHSLLSLSLVNLIRTKRTWSFPFFPFSEWVWCVSWHLSLGMVLRSATLGLYFCCLPSNSVWNCLTPVNTY